jgi:peptidyl-dipeptidase Dcp
MSITSPTVGFPDFANATPERFAPAFHIAMREHLAELDAIATCTDNPKFENTVLALDQSGHELERLSLLFGNLCAAETSPALQAVEREMSPILAMHGSQVALHEGVFARLDALHAIRATLGLDSVQLRLLERHHLDVVLGGARLIGSDRLRASEIAERLATIETQFAQNVLADESSWHIELEGEADLAGLPDWLRAAAQGAATDLSLREGAHAITLSRSLVSPFLTFSTRRDLRKRAWDAWIRRGENNNDNDNRALIVEILVLRRELANLHGASTFAEFQLADTMAQRPEAVAELLQRVWVPARSSAITEYEALNQLARHAGEPDVEGCDWRFYAEEIRRTTFDVDDDEVKPYFSLDAVLSAALDCAYRLFRIRFVEQTDVVTYHPDVRTFKVFDERDELFGIFMFDNFARPTKRGGAWMSSYQSRTQAPDRLPIVANHNNFAKGSTGSPTLLSIDDARTLFHEFGHGLHGLLSETPFRRLAGIQVLADFVELPSQLFEHWILEPDVLRRHARHVETGEAIPEDLIERLQRATLFNQGFETVEYCASALMDLALHQVDDPSTLDLDEFERATLADLGMPKAMVMRHRLPHFAHLFSSQFYASRYYVYLWAEVLDTDAFDAFREVGDPFDAQTADRLRTYVYSSGNTIEPGHAYREFRGRDASIEPLLRGRGLAEVG